MAEQQRPHALVVPALPTGHKNACMRIARSLRAAGFDVTFVCFSSRSVVQPPANDSSPQIGSVLSQLAAAALEGGGGGLATHVIDDGIPAQHLDKPFFATPAMKENLLNLILWLRGQGCPPTCIVSDSFVPWTVSVAQEAGIPRIEFWTSNALSFLLNLNLPNLRSKGIFPEMRGTKEAGGAGAAPPPWKSERPLMLDCIPCCPPISSELYPPELRFHDGPSPFLALFLEMCSCVEHADRILIYSIAELEPAAFRGLRAMGLPPVQAIGGSILHAVFQSEDGEGGTCTTSQTDGKPRLPEREGTNDCISWLDTQAESSVIYVAFGTVVSLSPEDMEELAMGLEYSGQAFLWAIRDAASHGDEGKWPQALEGFVQRTRGKGMVTAWAPQVKVLAHKAIGGFLTHAGWNSTVESLWEGVPMLCCPYLGDQRSNAWCICDLWKVGLELTRTSDGGLHRSDVELGVKALLQSEQGVAARKKAKEVMCLVRKEAEEGSESFDTLRSLYEDMKTLMRSKQSSTTHD